MQFTDKQLNEFKFLCEKNAGILLTQEEAEEFARKLIHLCKPILIPLVHQFLNDTDFLNDPNY